MPDERMSQEIDGDRVELTITAEAGCLLLGPLRFLDISARYADTAGELIRFSYQPESDPDLPPEPRRYARLTVEPLPVPLPAHHDCRDCPGNGGIGFDCSHMVRGRRLADTCDWCKDKGYQEGQEIPDTRTFRAAEIRAEARGMLWSGVETEVFNCLQRNERHERHMWQAATEHYTCPGDPRPNDMHQYREGPYKALCVVCDRGPGAHGKAGS